MVAESCSCRQREEWQWQTTNSDYGKFYAKLHKETMEAAVVHKGCEQKCNELSAELKLCKAQLEMMRLTGGHCSPCKYGHLQGHLQTPRPTSPKLGLCNCPAHPGPPNPDPFVSITSNEFNGGKQHEPQMLEDHIRHAHPRLVKRVEPKNFTPDPGRHMECCIRDEPHAYFTPVIQVVPVAPDQKRQARKPHGKEAAYSPRQQQSHEEPKIMQTQCKKARVGRYMNGKKVMVSCGSSVPPSQRYNFYRQYGFAGQGAKTSNGWHTK